MQTILAPRPVWIPVITALPGGALVRITAVRANEIVFDRVADLDGTTLSTAHGVPFSGYDPETDELPSVETVVAAIANPPPRPVVAPVVVLTPLTILGRLTQAEEAALASSSDLAVSIVRNRLIAASEVRSDDPRTAEGKAILVAKGIITAERAAVIFSP